MDALAVILEAPQSLRLGRLELSAPDDHDAVVDVAWSGISTGTERLLWSGRMPHFPGMGYPLVPGYESVGRIASVGPQASLPLPVGSWVFVPGARCFGPVRGLFGGAASRVVVPADRVTPISSSLGEEGVLLALAATAEHVCSTTGVPDLIVGHGVLGRLLARIAVARGATPTVWERDPTRAEGSFGYPVVEPDSDHRRDYGRIADVSGDASHVDELLSRLQRGGELVLAGFYSQPIEFSFPVAFMNEASIRIAAEWKANDMQAVLQLLEAGRLSLSGLITHRAPVVEAAQAYRTAFEDSACLKMLLDWRGVS
ncbi:MAG: chlorophyll synthesis pathway protein BchC [Myxococcota bacterium]